MEAFYDYNMTHKQQLQHNEVIKHMRVFFQSARELFKRHERIEWIVLYAGIMLLYGLYIWEFFRDILSTLSLHFGYLDTQEDWTALDHFVKGHRFFQDYFYQYGWFLTLLQSIPYRIFHETYLAELISRFIFLPVLGVLLSIITAWNIFHKKKLVWIFLFFAFSLVATVSHTVVRHQVAELAISFFILYFWSDKLRYVFIAGIIGGLSLLTSLEYGLALIIGIFILFILKILLKLKIDKKCFFYFFLGVTIIIVSYVIFVVGIEGMKNFIAFTGGFITNYYYASPCSGYSFPRFEDIAIKTPGSQLLIFGIPIEFLQHMNLYIVFIYYLIIGLLLFHKYRSTHILQKRDVVKLVILLYGGLVYVRTLDNPCVGFFAKGAVPFALLLTFSVDDIYQVMRRSKSTLLRRAGFIGLLLIFSWFTLTQLTNYPVRMFGRKIPPVEVETPPQEYFSWAGWKMDSKYVKEYMQINDYILKHTTPDDYVFVHPWGPYNIMTKRRIPNSIIDTTQYAAGEQFISRTVNELEQKQPKLVVVSITKNLSIAGYTEEQITHYRYLSVKDGVGLFFTGKGDKVQQYILENYQPVFFNDAAVVMEQRQKPIKISQHYSKVAEIDDPYEHSVQVTHMERWGRSSAYRVTGSPSEWKIVFNKPISASDIDIEFKVDGDFITKRLMRYWPIISAELAVDDDLGAKSQTIATKDWQTVRISLLNKREIHSVTISLDDSKGLIWWTHPYLLRVKDVTLYEWKK